jgi:hypothetical protein
LRRSASSVFSQGVSLGRAAPRSPRRGRARFSLDRAIGWDDNISGLWWGVAVIVAAAVASRVSLTLFRHTPTSQAAVTT